MSLYNLNVNLDRLSAAQLDLIDSELQVQDALRAVGFALRWERNKAGLSLRHVAKELGCSAVFLADCEKGHRQLSREKIEKYLKLLKGGAK